MWRKLKRKLKQIRGMPASETDYGMPWLHDFNPEHGFQLGKYLEIRIGKGRKKGRKKK